MQSEFVEQFNPAATHTSLPTPLLPARPPQFERQFENLDVQSEFVEQAMQNQAVLSTPEDDVNMLVQQVGRLGSWVVCPPACIQAAEQMGCKQAVEACRWPRLHRARVGGPAACLFLQACTACHQSIQRRPARS